MKEFIYKDFVPYDFGKQNINYIIREQVGVSDSIYLGRMQRSIPRAICKKLTQIKSDISEDAVLHKNYLKYLELAYDKDYGIVVKPDFIWYTILCEIARIIKLTPEKYKKYFSESENKPLLDGTSEEYQVLDIDKIFIELIDNQIPSNFTNDLIVPNFTTLTDKSKFAFKAAFLDAMSPYYSYGGYWCGFSKIKIYGEISDYQLMIDTINKILGVVPELEHLNTCIPVIQGVIDNWDNKEYWSEICKTEYGYAQHDVDGWFTKLFYNIDSKAQEAFPSHISKIYYTNSHNDDKFGMYVGILSSTIEDGCLVPDFNTVIMKIEKENL